MIIRKISAYRNDLSRVIIYFEDKSYITVLAERAKNLKVGDNIGENELAELSESSRQRDARATAARIVGHNSMSCATLLKKLPSKSRSLYTLKVGSFGKKYTPLTDSSLLAMELTNTFQKG